MKNKLTKIMGVGLSLMVLASMAMILPSAPASAGTLSITTETIPSAVNFQLTPGEHIADLAVVKKTVYAAMGSANKTYKSTDQGVTWDGISSTLKPASLFPNRTINKIAVAPDDENLVAVITGTPGVWYSIDGGLTWADLGTPAGMTSIRGIAVSQLRDNYHYFAVVGDNGANALVYVIKLGAGQVWTQVASTAMFFAFGQTQADAVAFSPDFSEDQMVLVVSSNASAAVFQALWYESPYNWNDNVTGFDGYGTGLTIATTSAALDSASIAIPPTYTGFDEGERNVFVGIAYGGTSGGVYRFTDTSIDQLKTWSGGAVGAINSLAYSKGDILVAGSYDKSQVLTTSDPYATDPKFDKVTTYKQPGGVQRTVVSWSDETLIAGTQGASSAFAVSLDDGVSFNDISLIDANITYLKDVTPGMDNSRVYLVSDDNATTSVWLMTTGWKRVFSATGINYIVRVSSTNPKTVYLGLRGGTDIYYSPDGGEQTWKKRPVYKLSNLVDMEVESDLVVDAIDTNGFSRTTNGGATWSTEVSLGVTGNAIMLTKAPNGDLFVGTANGYWAISKDQGETWDLSLKQVGDKTGNVQVLVDEGYPTTNIVYYSNDAKGYEGIYRGTSAIDTTYSTSTGVDTSALAATICSGLVMNSKVIYGAFYDRAGKVAGLIERSLEPTLDVTFYATRTSTTANFTFNAAPRALKLSTGPKIWAVSNAAGIAELYSMTDTIATVGPTLSGPSTGSAVRMNPVTGHSYDVTFSFKRASSKATKAQLQIATDSKGTSVVYNKADIATKEQDVNFITIGPGGDVGYKFEFMPATTYYWRVRVSVDGPFYSPWSKIQTIVVDPALGFKILDPAVGAVDVPIQPAFSWTEYPGAVGYEIMVSEDPTYAILEYSHTVGLSTYIKPDEKLAYSRTYYWRVRGTTGAADSKGVVPGGPWVSGVFTTVAEPKEPTPAVITIEKPAPPAQIQVVEIPVPKPAAIPSYLLWSIISIGAVLVIALIILIVRTRRVA